MLPSESKSLAWSQGPSSTPDDRYFVNMLQKKREMEHSCIGLLEACLSGDKVQVTSSDKGMNQIENNYLQTLSLDNHKVPYSGQSTIFGS